MAVFKSLIRLPYFGRHGALSRKDFDLCAEMNLGVGGIDILLGCLGFNCPHLDLLSFCFVFCFSP